MKQARAKRVSLHQGPSEADLIELSIGADMADAFYREAMVSALSGTARTAMTEATSDYIARRAAAVAQAAVEYLLDNGHEWGRV